MRIAPLQLSGVPSIAFVLSVFALASVISVDVAVAINDPVKQSEPASSATAVDIKQKSTATPDVQSRQKRKSKAFYARRQVVLDFLDQYFPELKISLLKSEKKSAGKFRNAVSRLESDIVRLRKFEQNNPERFELMVEQWKLKTQIEITIAKYAKKESDQQLEERLRPLAEQILDIRKSILKLDQQTMVRKLANIEKRLLNLESNATRVLERHMRSFQKSADKIRVKQKERQSAKSKAIPDTVNKTSEAKP